MKAGHDEFHPLLPFDEGPTTVSVHAKVERSGSLLRIEYRLGGEDVSDVRLDPPSQAAARKDGLWESTCFEAFIAEAGQPWYWELNLSPSLDWQAYHFREYRKGRKPESRITRVQGERLPGLSGWGYVLSVDTAGLFGARAALDLGITAVLERGGGKSYWALAHAGPKPDFHLRKSFVLNP